MTFFPIINYLPIFLRNFICTKISQRGDFYLWKHSFWAVSFLFFPIEWFTVPAAFFFPVNFVKLKFFVLCHSHKSFILVIFEEKILSNKMLLFGHTPPLSLSLWTRVYMRLLDHQSVFHRAFHWSKLLEFFSGFIRLLALLGHSKTLTDNAKILRKDALLLRLLSGTSRNHLKWVFT